MKIGEIKKYEDKLDMSFPREDLNEQGVIGTLLNSSEFILKSDWLKPSNFYNEKYGCIYNAINNLNKSGVIDIDNFMIIQEIEGVSWSKNMFKDVKDLNEFLDDLKTYSRQTIEEYELISKKVLSSGFKREAFITLLETGKNIISSESDINELNFNMQCNVSDFASKYIVNKETLLLGEQVDKIWDEITSNRNDSGGYGLPTIFKGMNDYYTFIRGEVIAYCAGAKVGKSQIMANECWNLACNGVGVLNIDREMNDTNHLIRFLSYLTGIDNRRIKSGELSLVEERMIKEKLNFIKGLNYSHVYKSRMTLDDLYITTKSAKLKNDIDVVCLDYIKSSTGDSTSDVYLEIGKQTQTFKDICGEMDLYGITGSQLNTRGSKPVIADSSLLERFISTAVFVSVKTPEEIAKDGKDAGNRKAQIMFNRLGDMMLDDEYYNMTLRGDISTISEAKIPFTRGINNPY